MKESTIREIFDEAIDETARKTQEATIDLILDMLRKYPTHVVVKMLREARAKSRKRSKRHD